MKNIHLIPTSQPSRLHKIGNELGLTDKPNSNFLAKQQNIYITSNEEIKEGVDQWYLDKFLNKLRNSSGSQYAEKQDVIILTTDQDLIKDGVQAIDDDFLEWFVKNPNCKEVEVFHQDVYSMSKWDRRYKIIIPKEELKQIKCYCGHTTYCDCGPLEEPKQETTSLEEAAEKWSLQKAQEFALNKFKQKNTTKKGIVTWELVLEVLKVGVLTGHKFGAKCQQERMFKLHEDWQEYIKVNFHPEFSSISFRSYIEQFKKK